MAHSHPLEAFYETICEAEFGRHAASVLKFLAAHRKRGTKLEEPRRDFNHLVGDIFNHGLLVHFRKSLWQPLEEARTSEELQQKQLADDVRLTPSTYSKIEKGETNLESIVLFLRRLGLEWRALPVPSRAELTVAGLLTVLPVAKYEALGMEKPADRARQQLTPEDVEWMFQLDACGAVWVEAFLSNDEQAGSLISTCIAAGIGIRLGRRVEVRPFSAVVDLWKGWISAWELCMGALPTGKLV